MSIEKYAFGALPNGRAIERYRLKAGSYEADILTWGGVVSAVRAPDRSGAIGDVVLGFDTLEGYAGNLPYLGVLVGRYGNRIANATFTLGGQTYRLANNDGANHLHGGPGGFSRQVWEATAAGDGPDGPALTLHYLSPDGEEGYPGNLDVTVVYTLTPGGELRIEYTATTDKLTVVNLTNHTYFNLAGSGDVLDHTMQIPASAYLPTDAGQIPTGELRPVAGTALDFRTPRPIGERIADDEQLVLAEGYDHCWILDKPAGTLGLGARVTHPASGRVLEMETTEPAVQFYAGNKLGGQLTGRGGHTYVQYAGFCLEAQHYPDSPNQPDFPSTELRPGETYRQTTVYRFTHVE